MRRTLLASSFLLALTAVVTADVAPYPAWRITVNGSIAGAAQSGGAIYIGGSFTKIGRGVAPFEGFLDLSTLTLVSDPGCARDRGVLLGTAGDGTSRLVASDGPFASRLSDGAGPFVVGDDVRYVRVGADCRFDRHFAVRLPVPGGLWGSPVYLGDSLYSAVHVATFPFPGRWYVAAFDARTGDLRHAWPVPSSTALAGVGSNGRLAVTWPVTSPLPNTLTLGFFDPATGGTSTNTSLPDAAYGTVTTLGDRALVAWSILENGRSLYRLDLFDLATWQRLPAWEDVRASSSLLITAASSDRVAIAASGLSVSGATERALQVFDLVTGAPDPGWAPPAWLASSGTTIRQVAITGSRIVVVGEFVPGAPRDTLAVLDLATGALDDWHLDVAAGYTQRAGGRVYLGSITATGRVARRHFAAVDAVTGDVLPWNPGALLPADGYLPVTAYVHDGLFAYAAHPGKVRRYDLATGTSDPTWGLDAVRLGSLPATLTALGVGSGAVYVTGDLDSARASGAGSFESRSGGAAITVSGVLTSWNPRVTPSCSYGGRIRTYFACVMDAAVTADRVFLRGHLTFLDAPADLRFIGAVSTDAGERDTRIPPVFVTGFTSTEGVLHAAVSLDAWRLVRVDPGLRTTVLPEALQQVPSYLAARNGRVYAGVEVDATTAGATGNSKVWLRPMPAAHGMLDADGLGLAFHADLTGVPPGRPSGLVPAVSGDRVTLTWTRAPGDLQPLVPAPPAGGTAATSHLVRASLTPGGPAVAQLDTASADTTFSITAPAGIFFVHVVAKNAFGTSEPSNEVRVEVRPGPPDPPVATVATVVSDDVRLQWQAPPTGWPATGYVLEAGSRSGAADIAVAPVNGITFTATRVPPGRYFVRVRAVNVHGASVPGEEVVVDVGSLTLPAR